MGWHDGNLLKKVKFLGLFVIEEARRDVYVRTINANFHKYMKNSVRAHIKINQREIVLYERGILQKTISSSPIWLLTDAHIGDVTPELAFFVVGDKKLRVLACLCKSLEDAVELVEFSKNLRSTVYSFYRGVLHGNISVSEPTSFVDDSRTSFDSRSLPSEEITANKRGVRVKDLQRTREPMIAELDDAGERQRNGALEGRDASALQYASPAEQYSFNSVNHKAGKFGTYHSEVSENRRAISKETSPQLPASTGGAAWRPAEYYREKKFVEGSTRRTHSATIPDDSVRIGVSQSDSVMTPHETLRSSSGISVVSPRYGSGKFSHSTGYDFSPEVTVQRRRAASHDGGVARMVARGVPPHLREINAPTHVKTGTLLTSNHGGSNAGAVIISAKPRTSFEVQSSNLEGHNNSYSEGTSQSRRERPFLRNADELQGSLKRI